MTTHPTIAALRARLESERNVFANPYLVRSDLSPKLWSEGHEAATERLMTVLEQTLAVIEFYANEDNWDRDSWGSPIEIIGESMGGETAREFLAELEKELK